MGRAMSFKDRLRSLTLRLTLGRAIFARLLTPLFLVSRALGRLSTPAALIQEPLKPALKAPGIRCPGLEHLPMSPFCFQRVRSRPKPRGSCLTSLTLLAKAPDRLSFRLVRQPAQPVPPELFQVQR